MNMNILKILKCSYQASVKSVLPGSLMTKWLQRNGEQIVIANDIYRLQHNVYVYGFGKAVINMVKPIEDLLRNEDGTSHLKFGIVSVPFNIKNNIQNKLLLPDPDSKIVILEGASNNIPDNAAFNAAKNIVESLESLNNDDLAIILISGGGSALLPFPTPPMTLDEKTHIIKTLSNAGADIVELNTVRKVLSETKGGKLAERTKAKILCLILSDVINSPLDAIASGPTVPNTKSVGDARDILDKYNIYISNAVEEALSKQEKSQEGNFKEFSHVSNYIVGDNKVALGAGSNALMENAKESMEIVIVTSCLNGNAMTIAEAISSLCVSFSDVANGLKSDIPSAILEHLCAENEEQVREKILRCAKEKKKIVMFFGGETTVHVKGKGCGGRNQETVLALTIMLNELDSASPIRGVYFLSGGTDGIDGPTTAAGAMTYWTPQRSLYNEALEQRLTPEAYLEENDSFTFFSRLSKGAYLLTPGHTGTNVMDVLILCIDP